MGTAMRVRFYFQDKYLGEAGASPGGFALATMPDGGI
jgi:hypothetical protein